MPALDKELKKAILQLPFAEKDKMLLRLIAKDSLLTEQLNFTLIEEGTTLDERRTLLKQQIADTAAGNYDHADGWLLKSMRRLQAEITLHHKITKDNYGEAELTLYLLCAFVDAQGRHFWQLNRYNERACQFMAKRTEMLLKKLAKLDSDYYVEFETDVNNVLTFLYENGPATYARLIPLPKRWET